MSLVAYNDKKRDFAYAILKNPKDYFAAAREIVKNDSFAALKMVQEWPHDEDVKKHQRDLINEHGEEHFLPTKADMVKKLMDESETILDSEVKLKYYKLAAEICGHLQKDTVNIQNNMTTNKVMMMQVSESDEAWEARVAQQQAQLIIEAEAINVRTGA